MPGIFDLNDGPLLIKNQFYLRVAQAIGTTVTVAQDVFKLGDDKGGKGKKRRLLRAVWVDFEADSELDDLTENKLRFLDANGTISIVNDTLTKKKGDKKDDGGSDIFGDISFDDVLLIFLALVFLYLSMKAHQFGKRGGDFRGPAQLGAIADVGAIVLFFLDEIKDKDFMQLTFIATLISLPFSYGVYKNYAG